MKIVGCDFHPSFQQVAILDISKGGGAGVEADACPGEAERLYRALESPVLIGMESMGNSLWFERLMEQLGHELWIGDAAQIRASYVRRQKTDKRDAGHILTLLLEKRFPRIWVPSNMERDQRQLLLQRLLMTQPGVGPITALAFVVTIGDWSRFKRGKQVASYLGLIPPERSSGQKRRLGAISKQGNVFLRTMLVEAAQSAVRHDEDFKKEYAQRCHPRIRHRLDVRTKNHCRWYGRIDGWWNSKLHQK